MSAKVRLRCNLSQATELRYASGVFLGGLNLFRAIFMTGIFLAALAFAGVVLAGSIDQVELQRTGCYGSCPAYTVTIKSDGSVIFEGKDHVQRKGRSKATVAPADWDLLVAVLNRSHFFALKGRYSTEEDGCTTVWTDSPALGITATRGAEKKRVWYYQGCRGPQELDAIAWLGATIDLIANTQKWVGQD